MHAPCRLEHAVISLEPNCFQRVIEMLDWLRCCLRNIRPALKREGKAKLQIYMVSSDEVQEKEVTYKTMNRNYC